MTKKLPPIPPHLAAAYPWYAPHQAWLKAVGLQPFHEAQEGMVAERAELRKKDFSWTNLSGMGLAGVDFSHADLGHSNLSGSDLYFANFSYVDLAGSHLLDANLKGVTLTGARGLHRLNHGARLSQLLSGAWVYVPGPMR